MIRRSNIVRILTPWPLVGFAMCCNKYQSVRVSINLQMSESVELDLVAHIFKLIACKVKSFLVLKQLRYGYFHPFH